MGDEISTTDSSNHRVGKTRCGSLKEGEIERNGGGEQTRPGKIIGIKKKEEDE